MARNLFDSRDQVDRVRPVLEGIGRRAWERTSVSAERKGLVSRAYGEFWNQLRIATEDLRQHAHQSLVEPPRGIDVDEENWSAFARQELVDMIGRNDICSVADAFLKTTALLRALPSSYGHQRFLFRGQRNIAWRLLPRKARKLLAAGWTPPTQHLDERKLTCTLPEELESLAAFRRSWRTLEGVEDVDREKQLADDHPEWWFLMQHYDAGGGTRLLDATTSLTAALLFACVNWSTGAVDDTTDGIVYLWKEGTNANIDDFLLRRMPSTAEGLFSGYQDATVHIFNPPPNERSKAQSGAFLWWPRFWDDLPSGAPYYLRIVASAKREIVRDLLSMGFGPKEAVRGVKGLENERSLRSQVGLPPWDPFELTRA